MDDTGPIKFRQPDTSDEFRLEHKDEWGHALPGRSSHGSASQCDHDGYAVVVDEHRCQVCCKGCGQPLDPFAVLLKMSKKETRLVRLYEHDWAVQDRARMERREQDRIAKSTCKHTRARKYSSENTWYCPSCQQTFTEPVGTTGNNPNPTREEM